MAGPMFIREPLIGVSYRDDGSGFRGIPGQDLTTAPNGTTWTELHPFFDVQEAALVEEIRWCAHGFSTEAGELLLAIRNEDYNAISTNPYAWCSIAVPAGTATQHASGVLAVNFALQVGYSLLVAHSIKVSGGGSFAELDIVAGGGIVR